MTFRLWRCFKRLAEVHQKNVLLPDVLILAPTNWQLQASTPQVACYHYFYNNFNLTTAQGCKALGRTCLWLFLAIWSVPSGIRKLLKP